MRVYIQMWIDFGIYHIAAGQIYRQLTIDFLGGLGGLGVLAVRLFFLFFLRVLRVLCV